MRILTSGTEAVTRVMVESADGKGARWSTVGVSANIVDASFEALADSICYKLFAKMHMRDRVTRMAGLILAASAETRGSLHWRHV